MEPFKNVAENVKNLERSNTEFSDYLKNIKLQAEDLVLNEFPRRVLKLEDLLKKHFNVKNLSVENVSQKLQVDTDSDSDSSLESKAEEILKKYFKVEDLYLPAVPNQSLHGADSDENVPKKRKMNTGKVSLKVSKAIANPVTDQNLQCKDVKNVSKKRQVNNTDSGPAPGSKAEYLLKKFFKAEDRYFPAVPKQSLHGADKKRQVNNTDSGSAPGSKDEELLKKYFNVKYLYLPAVPNQTVHGADKKRQVNNTDSGSAPGSKAFESVVSSVNHVIDLINLFSPHAHQLLRDIDLLKKWLYFDSLQTENSDYYAKSTLDLMLSETQKVERSTKAFLDEISPYLSSRGDIVSKMSKEPNVEEYRWSVMKKDESFSIKTRQIILELERYYAILNSMVCENLEKMQEPKT